MSLARCPHCGGSLARRLDFTFEASPAYVETVACSACGRESPHRACSTCLYPQEASSMPAGEPPGDVAKRGRPPTVISASALRSVGGHDSKVPCPTCEGMMSRRSQHCSACEVRRRREMWNKSHVEAI